MRRAPEPPKRQWRSAFERDRARLVHSSAMRRLGAKTQVLTPGADDFSRTRLTHSLEVAQIGREMGRALGADPDLVDTACLAHDIGHPPFGHNGERALAEAAADIGGFEGNAQTLRILSRLESKILNYDGTSAGLNLTRAALDACVKYPWSFTDRPYLPDGTRSPKFGIYDDDAPVFNWLRDINLADSGQTGKVPTRPIEAQIMDLADDIAYSVHDVEDAIVARRVDFSVLDDPDALWEIIVATQDWYGDWFDGAELEAAFGRLKRTGLLLKGFDGSRLSLSALKDATSSLIGRFSGSAQAATRGQYGGGPLTRYHGQLVVPADTKMEILALKGVAVRYVMAPREGDARYAQQRELLAELVAMVSATVPYSLEPDFAGDWLAAETDAARLRVVIDQVATLTDVSALQWYEKLRQGVMPSHGGFRPNQSQPSDLADLGLARLL
ncbi:MAG: deoxyguanosinetriphosphate triphosphohydrolase [Promicromonosporaceae bacterium]|nr:deoxyguanosinetriphosphate triphosphohydrolase [Promicromonosporaceae bacterium]